MTQKSGILEFRFPSALCSDLAKSCPHRRTLLCSCLHGLSGCSVAEANMTHVCSSQLSLVPTLQAVSWPYGDSGLCLPMCAQSALDLSLPPSITLVQACSPDTTHSCMSEFENASMKTLQFSGCEDDSRLSSADSPSKRN